MAESTSFVCSKNLQLAYRKTGQDKQAFVLLHGWACDFSIFKHIQDALSEHFTVYAFDLPGFGKSEEPPQAWDTEAYADCLLEAFEALSIENPYLLGHSFGGKVSLHLANKIQIKGLILVGSAGIKPKRSLYYYWKVYSFKTMKKAAILCMGKKASERHIEQWRKKSGSADYKNSSEMMRKVLVKSVHEDLQRLMPKIQASCLLVWGEYDTATPLSDAKIMEKKVPEAGLAVMKQCTHYCFIEKPELFMRILLAFVLKR